MIKEKTVPIKWWYNNRKHYESKGYSFTKFGDYFDADVKDLSVGCRTEITAICDKCGSENKIIYKHYALVAFKHNNGEYFCDACRVPNLKEKLMDTYGVENQFQRKEIQEKSKDTCMKHFGTEYYAQTKMHSESMKGERNNFWIDGRNANYVARNSSSTKTFARLVKQRDNYTCFACGYKAIPKNGKTREVEAHHIIGYAVNPEIAWDLNNGITLCRKCHKNFHTIYGYGENTKDQFNEWLISKGKSIDYQK